MPLPPLTQAAAPSLWVESQAVFGEQMEPVTFSTLNF